MIRKLTASLLCFMLTLSLFGVSFVSGSTLNDTPKTVKASAGANKNNKQKTEKKDTKTKKELSLAERICGKYSHYDKESEDFETLSFACFGDNLYAYAGRAFDEEEDSLTNYSIWAIEYIPEDAEDLKSYDADSVKVKALSFSNMSLLGRYQGDAVEGTIRLTKDGLVLEDFGSTGKTEYKKDDRVEDAFACLDKEPSAGYEKLQGYWCMKADYDPVYLFFDGSNMYIYRKLPGLEVTFYGGEYSVSGNELSVYLGSIESASEPFEGKTEFTIKKDILTFLDDGLDGIDMYFEGYEFERIDKEDIPVYTAEDVLMPYLDPDAGPEDLFVADADTRPFYGVFVSSTKDRDAAIKTAEKLIDDGYDGTVTHTTEWAGLNKDPYCVVLAGRFDTKEDAEAVLKDVKKDGYKDAFVKYSGECNGLRVNVTAFTTNSVNVRKDCVILRFGHPVFTYDWSPYFEEFGYETWGDIFYVDENTEFDKSCDMEGFARYKKGDTVLDWYQRNNSLMNKDPESNATDAFVGVFDVSVSGNHVNRYYGIYWWD